MTILRDQPPTEDDYPILEELKRRKEEVKAYMREMINLSGSAFPLSQNPEKKVVNNPAGAQHRVVPPFPARPLYLESLWQNPYPQGSPEARAESLRVVVKARREAEAMHHAPVNCRHHQRTYPPDWQTKKGTH